MRAIFMVLATCLAYFEMMAFRLGRRARNFTDTTSIEERCASVSFGRNSRGYAHTFSEECFQAHDDCVLGMWPKSDGTLLNAWRGFGPACCYQPQCKDLGKETCAELPDEPGPNGKLACEENCKMPMKTKGTLGFNKKMNQCFVQMSMAYGKISETMESGQQYRKGITGNKPPDIICVKDDLTTEGRPHCNYFLEQINGRIQSELDALMALDEPIRRLSVDYRNAVDMWLWGNARVDQAGEAAKEQACDDVEKANKEVVRIMTPLTSVTPTRPMALMFNNMKTLLGIVQTNGGRATELGRVAFTDPDPLTASSAGHVLTGAYAVTRAIVTMYGKFQATAHARRKALGDGLVGGYCDLISCMDVNSESYERQVQVMDPLYGQEFEGSPISCKVCSAYGMGVSTQFMKELNPFFNKELYLPLIHLGAVCHAIVPIRRGETQSFHPPRLPNFDCFESHHTVIGEAMGLLQDAIEAIRTDLSGVADEFELNPSAQAKIAEFSKAADKAYNAVNDDKRCE